MAGLLVWSAAKGTLVPLTPAGVGGGQTELFWFRDDPDGMCAGKPQTGEDTPEYWAKIRALIAYPAKPDGVAWPLEVFLDARDKRTPTVFSMKRLRGRPLSEMVIKAVREDEQLDWGMDEFREVAIQLATLYARLERQGITQVDNHGGNFLLDWSLSTKAPREVSRLDALSFGFHHGGSYWFTDKTALEFVAPEYHGKDLSKTVMTRESDRFSLGCWMFALLVGGFPWNFAGGGAPTPAERVREKQFAMYTAPSGAMVPKAIVDGFHALPVELIVLLERALLGAPTQRPTPTDWVNSLRATGKNPAPTRKFWPAVIGRARKAAGKAQEFTRAYRWAAAGVAALGLTALLAPRPNAHPAQTSAADEPPPTHVQRASSEPAPAASTAATDVSLTTRQPVNPEGWKTLVTTKRSP